MLILIHLILYSVIFLLFGILILVLPETIDYTNTENWFFDLTRFLKDYPQFKCISGIVSIVLGLIGFIFVIFYFIQKNHAFIIQQSADGDYGNPALSFPKIFIGIQEPLFYENITSQNRYETSILDLDKERIKRFYTNVKNKKCISFLGVALFPFIVYAGYIVGNSGQKVSYFHYDRKKAVSRWLPFFGSINNDFKISTLNESSSSGLVIAVSVSYLIDKEIIKKQFFDEKIICLDADKIGIDVINNRKSLIFLADKIRKTIDQESKKFNSISLLLSCPAELCFALGQCLCSPGLPRICVYNFKKSDNTSWNWSIFLE